MLGCEGEGDHGENRRGAQGSPGDPRQHRGGAALRGPHCKCSLAVYGEGCVFSALSTPAGGGGRQGAPTHRRGCRDYDQEGQVDRPWYVLLLPFRLSHCSSLLPKTYRLQGEVRRLVYHVDSILPTLECNKKANLSTFSYLLNLYCARKIECHVLNDCPSPIIVLDCTRISSAFTA